MTDCIHLLREPIQHILRDFAYLDLEVLPGYCQFHSDWALASAVECSGRCRVSVAVLMNLNLGIRTADGMLGIESSFRQQVDVLGELANVLAGNAYEILCDGLRPNAVSTPKILTPHLASMIWNGSPGEFRYLLRDGETIEGGLVIAFES